MLQSFVHQSFTVKKLFKDELEKVCFFAFEKRDISSRVTLSTYGLFGSVSSVSVLCCLLRGNMKLNISIKDYV